LSYINFHLSPAKQNRGSDFTKTLLKTKKKEKICLYALIEQIFRKNTAVQQTNKIEFLKIVNYPN